MERPLGGLRERLICGSKKSLRQQSSEPLFFFEEVRQMCHPHRHALTHIKDYVVPSLGQICRLRILYDCVTRIVTCWIITHEPENKRFIEHPASVWQGCSIHAKKPYMGQRKRVGTCQPLEVS